MSVNFELDHEEEFYATKWAIKEMKKAYKKAVEKQKELENTRT